MKPGPALDSPSGGRSGRFLPCVVCFGFGLALRFGNELLAITCKVLLNLLPLRFGGGRRLGITRTAADDRAGDAECEHEQQMRPHATPGIMGCHNEVSLPVVLLSDWRDAASNWQTDGSAAPHPGCPNAFASNARSTKKKM
jgi:hypothetical protein